jgi:hydroxymethylbilane synthase
VSETPLPSLVVLASRGSALALRQTDIVAGLIRAAHPSVEVEVVTTTTAGDADKSRPFAAIGGKGLFTTEVERLVLEGRADAAVHSAKDLTAELAPGGVLAAATRRAPAGDVVVGGDGVSGEDRLMSLASDRRVGTSSMRRRALLAELRPDVEPVELRGNLDTRLRKVAEGAVDAAIVAAAGIERLGVAGEVGPASLDQTWWVPPPGQGILAIEVAGDREDLATLFGGIGDRRAWTELVTERAFAAELEGGCSVPLGCRAHLDGDRLVVTGYLGTPDGSVALRDRISGPVFDGPNLGRDLGRAMLAAGGSEILEELKSLTTPDIPEITAP